MKASQSLPQPVKLDRILSLYIRVTGYWAAIQLKDNQHSGGINRPQDNDIMMQCEDAWP